MEKKYSFKASPAFLQYSSAGLTNPQFKVITADISFCHDRIIIPEHMISDFAGLQILLDEKEVFVCGDCGGKQICHSLMKKPNMN